MVNENPPEMASQFEADLIWLSKHPLIPGRQYQINLVCKAAGAAVTAIKYRTDSNTGARLAARTLNANETGRIHLYTRESLIFEHQNNKNDFNFLLTDRQTGETVGTGTIDFVLRRAANLQWQALAIDEATRFATKATGIHIYLTVITFGMVYAVTWVLPKLTVSRISAAFLRSPG